MAVSDARGIIIRGAQLSIVDIPAQGVPQRQPVEGINVELFDQVGEAVIIMVGGVIKKLEIIKYQLPSGM